MASTKISDMTAATDVSSSVIPIVQGGVNKKASNTLFVSDDAYDSSWNGVTTVAPSKNAVYDKIETLSSSLDSDQLELAYLTSRYYLVWF